MKLPCTLAAMLLATQAIAQAPPKTYTSRGGRYQFQLFKQAPRDGPRLGNIFGKNLARLVLASDKSVLFERFLPGDSHPARAFVSENGKWVVTQDFDRPDRIAFAVYSAAEGGRSACLHSLDSLGMSKERKGGAFIQTTSGIAWHPGSVVHFVQRQSVDVVIIYIPATQPVVVSMLTGQAWTGRRRSLALTLDRQAILKHVRHLLSKSDQERAEACMILSKLPGGERDKPEDKGLLAQIANKLREIAQANRNSVLVVRAFKAERTPLKLLARTALSSVEGQ